MCVGTDRSRSSSRVFVVVVVPTAIAPLPCLKVYLVFYYVLFRFFFFWHFFFLKTPQLL